MKVVLDIETVQAPREEWARIIGKPLQSHEDFGFEPSGDLFTVGAAEERRRAEDELYAKSAFDGTFSRVVCIGLLEFSDQMEARGAVAWYGQNERE
ncbi:MAG: hypothetical protein NNA22_09705, partial [Nitrospira sp.]|nr:hypothetical protein [Nitrospira sp.]